MRVRSIIATLLLCCFQLSALAQEQPYEVESDAEACCPSTWFRADLLYWQPHLRSVDYASTEDGSSLAIGAGRTHRVEFDRDPGFRVGLGHMTDMGWGLGVEYTYFSSSTGVATVERPGGVGQLFSTLSHPGGPEEADIATATTTLDYATYDITAATRVVDREYQSFDIFGGLRWATIVNELDAFFDGRDFVNGTIEDRMDVNAFGVAFGTEGHWRLRSGWFIFGRSSFAALYGNIRNTRVETNLNGAEQLVDFEDEYVEPLFNFETRIGLAKSLGRCEVRAGYDLNIWTGIGDRVRFTDDIEETAYSAASGDLLLEGFFLQLAYSW